MEGPTGWRGIAAGSVGEPGFLVFVYVLPDRAGARGPPGRVVTRPRAVRPPPKRKSPRQAGALEATQGRAIGQATFLRLVGAGVTAVSVSSVSCLPALAATS